MRRQLPWVVVVMPLVATVMTGCMGEQPRSDVSDTTEPAAAQLLNVTDLRTFELPLDPYRINRVNLSNSTKAEQLLVQRCLRRFGFDYQLPGPAAPAVVGAERRYGLADEASARARGYHFVPAAPVKNAELVTEAKAVLLGEGQSSYGGQLVPEGGCAGEARRKLAEGAPKVENERLGDSLAAESFDRTSNDSRVQKVYGEWSACMRRAGYNYADPMKAVNDPQFVSSTATAREIAVATADVRCKNETNLINTMASIETAYQQRALERNAEALSVIQASITVREKNAAAVLAGS